MEELRVSTFRQGSVKSALSGRSTPRSSPTYKKVHSGRTPRRDSRSSGGGVQWFRSNRIVYWLLLITLWAYLGFYLQSRWAHDNKNEKFLGFGGKFGNGVADSNQDLRRELIENVSSPALKIETRKVKVSKSVNVALTTKENGVSRRSKTPTKRSKKSGRKITSKVRNKQKATTNVDSKYRETLEQELPKTNATYGRLMGPFGPIEDRILEWSPVKRSGTCDRKGDFARLVWSRRFILVFHEVSMTGAPISMMELATELLSCGATVSAVVLSKKGGLLPELARRRIKVIEDKGDLSFKTAMKADLVIAGSAVCASWIDQYIEHFPAGGSQVAWWIMENRREYFDRAKPVLDRVKMLIFLSEMQSKQWLTWCEEEKVKLRSQPVHVPLSVNDELAFVAGLSSSLNTPSFSPEKMLEKRQLLRKSIRNEMGLTDSDMLVMALSSINRGKGQLLLLESAALIFENKPSVTDSKVINPSHISLNRSSLAAKHRLRGLLQNANNGSEDSNIVKDTNLSSIVNTVNDPYVASSGKVMQEQALKILIGSVGSKSNKIPYVKEMLSYLSQNVNLSKSVIWTPATTRIASLYSAADVYVINSQGLGETFGRVTIEAMAFGLPVLGTDAGGTIEIVEHNVTGLLHPIGHLGNPVLAQNLRILLKNPSARRQMGVEGRKKVELMYMKRHMYKKFVDVLYKCMRPK